MMYHGEGRKFITFIITLDHLKLLVNLFGSNYYNVSVFSLKQGSFDKKTRLLHIENVNIG